MVLIKFHDELAHGLSLFLTAAKNESGSRTRGYSANDDSNAGSSYVQCVHEATAVNESSGGDWAIHRDSRF